MQQHIGLSSVDGIVGTGPSGLPDGKRWVTPQDVLRYASDVLPAYVRDREWDRDMDDEVPRPALAHRRRADMQLWNHQCNAVAACMTAPGTFTSGIIDMDCGTGKSLVGAELIRRSRAPAIVVTQHATSVTQWVYHLRDIVGLSRIFTLCDVRTTWKAGRDDFPEALVLTYAVLARAVESMTHGYEGGGFESTDATIIWLARVKRFGLLILDEVHLAAADHFRLACSLRASAVVGLSGSLVREDDRLVRLESLVGDVLFRYRAERNVNYSVVRVSIPSHVNGLLCARKRRAKEEHAIRTLNPQKIAALRRIVTMESIWQNRIVVFCDSAEAAPYLPDMLNGQGGRWCVGVTHGKKKQTTRDAMVEEFHVTERAIIVSTRVCDAAVDFPKGCVVVQLHSSSGSRQQEVQRCGRGTRGDVNTARIIHVVNMETEEEGFVERRMKHMRELYGEGMKMLDAELDDVETLQSDEQPLKEFIKKTATRTPDGLVRQIKKRHRGKPNVTWRTKGISHTDERT